MKKIMWPTMPNETLYDAWNAASEGEVGVLGSGSDYASFLHKGISSSDVGTYPGADDPVYHYHRYVYPSLIKVLCNLLDLIFARLWMCFNHE